MLNRKQMKIIDIDLELEFHFSLANLLRSVAACGHVAKNSLE